MLWKELSEAKTGKSPLQSVGSPSLEAPKGPQSAVHPASQDGLHTRTAVDHEKVSVQVFHTETVGIGQPRTVHPRYPFGVLSL